MNYSLKEILNSRTALFVTQKESVTNKELNILNIFFHKIILVHSAIRAQKEFSQKHPDVIIVGIDFPDNSGIDLCKKLRKINPTLPIIILSTKKDEEYLFAAIRLQVIDFVIRPTKSEDLIYALNLTAKNILNHGSVAITLSNGYIYNYSEKSILKNDGTIVTLTKNEFRLLELLIANKKQTLKKEEIEAYLWADEEITQSAFKSLFSRLRQKVGKENIQNSFGIGYQLV